MKRIVFILLCTLCASAIWAEKWEKVHMFVVPQSLWNEGWSDSYTLRVSLKRWNGSDSDKNNWDSYTFYRTDALYDKKPIYAGDVWVCFGGFAQMTFEGIGENDSVMKTYTFWPPEKAENKSDHWITKEQFQNKVFTSWKIDGLKDFPFISSEIGHRIYFDNSSSQWANVYLRIGRDALTGAGNYAATWPMTKIANTDIWFVDTEAWDNALVWTITDVNDNNGDLSVYNLPDGANRLYFYSMNINQDFFYVADGASAQGEAEGKYYWANHNFARKNIYSRNISRSDYGTICLPKKAAIVAGAQLYSLVDKTAENDGIVIEEVESLQAGEPYIFMATADVLVVAMTGTAQDAKTSNGLVGYIGSEATTLEPDETNRYIIAYNKLWQVDEAITMPSNRAYIDMSGIAAIAPSPTRVRHIIRNVDATQTATAIEHSSSICSYRKIIIDGQVYIQEGDKIFSILGQRIQ